MPEQRREVAVAVATLWADPDRPGPRDAPATGVPADVRGWVAGLDDTGSVALRGRVLTQLLFGERVVVDQVRDGWARVVAVEQPAPRRDPRGYPGWLPAAQLAPVASDPVGGPAATDPAGGSAPVTGRPTGQAGQDGGLVVAATATALRDEPDGDVAMAGLVIGTRLVPAGAPGGGWQPVCAPGRPYPLWARQRDLAPPPTGTPDGGLVLETAARLLDVPYVWGGLSAYGIDCSGLVHLAFRRHGVRLPRDADDQAGAMEAVPLGDERVGDVYLFAHPHSPVHHIGLVAAAGSGRRQMLHACGTRRRVVLEPVAGEREKTLVAAARLPGTR